MDVVKPVGTEINCNTTLSTFGNCTCVRIFNTTAANALITRKNAANTFQYTVTLVANGVIAVAKLPTDTLESNNATTGVVGSPIAFQN